MTGILRFFAAKIVGIETYPPLENITSGLISSSSFPAGPTKGSPFTGSLDLLI